jgi:hypothetical protein
VWVFSGGKLIDLIRLDDDTDHGGKVITASSTMRFDGKCVFHTKLDSDFAPSWTGISREGGHGFHGKLDSDFTRSWTVAA